MRNDYSIVYITRLTVVPAGMCRGNGRCAVCIAELMHRSGALSSRIKRHGGAAYLGGDTGGVAALYGQSVVAIVLDDCGEGNSAVGICGECAAVVPRCAALGDFGEVGLAISVDIGRGSGIQHQIGERVHCGAHIVGIGCRRWPAPC